MTDVDINGLEKRTSLNSKFFDSEQKQGEEEKLDDEDLHNEIKTSFKLASLQRQTTMGLVMNLNMIHMILIGMASMLDTIISEKAKRDSTEEDELAKLIVDSDEKAKAQLKQEAVQSRLFNIDADKFC